MDLTVVFRDNEVKEYKNAFKAFEDNGKILKVRYANNSTTDYIPLINIKTITVKDN